MQSKKAYELVTTGRPENPAFPHAMVLTVSFVISPVIGLCCHRRFACAKLVASVEASGPHDFAVRVQHRSSKVPNSVHRIPPRVRDDRERPLVGRDSAIRTVFCLVLEARYFCAEGWTGDLRKCPGPVIASAATQSSFERPSWIRTSWIASSPRSQRKRFAFVAGNDGARYTRMTANARPSRHRDSACIPAQDDAASFCAGSAACMVKPS